MGVYWLWLSVLLFLFVCCLAKNMNLFFHHASKHFSCDRCHAPTPAHNGILVMKPFQFQPELQPNIPDSLTGLLAEPIVSSITRLVCFAFDIAWFRCDLLLGILVDCRFASVSWASLLLNARDPADFAVFAVFPILLFGSLSPPYSFSSILRWSCQLCDYSPHSSPCPGKSSPFTLRYSWDTNATLETPVRNKTIMNATMPASWHAISTKASINAAKHHSFSFSFLLNDCSNHELTSNITSCSLCYVYIPTFVSLISVFFSPNYLQQTANTP